MKSLIDAIIMGTYLYASLWSGKWAIKTAYDKIQMFALEKAATGLGSMEKITEQLTGRKLTF